MERTIERRKQDRVRVTAGVFAAIWPQFAVIGPIVDITDEGLSFCYLASEDRTTGASQLTVSLADGTFQERSLPIETAWDEPCPSEFSCGPITQRRCGLKFGRLAEGQKAAIRYLIETTAATHPSGLGRNVPVTEDARVAAVH